MHVDEAFKFKHDLKLAITKHQGIFLNFYLVAKKNAFRISDGHINMPEDRYVPGPKSGILA